MEKVRKVCCQADNFETLVQRKIDSSLIVYILSETSGLKNAMNRSQVILRLSAF
jgi:hypothetical protein